MKERQQLQRGDRVRATRDIRMEEHPFCDIKAGTEGTVVAKDMPEKARSCWSVVMRVRLFVAADLLSADAAQARQLLVEVQSMETTALASLSPIP